MAELLIVVDSAAKAEVLKGYHGSRAECVVCGWPLFRISYQPHPAAPSGLLFQFDGLPAGEGCIARLQAYHDKEIHLVLDANPRANYLCWQIGGYLAQIGGRPEAVKRLSPTSFDQEGIDTALRFASPVDERQGLAYYSRLLFDEGLARHLIRLIGADRGPGNLPLRQTSLTALFLLADRERECLLSQPVPKWQVQAELAAADRSFTATLAKGLDLPADGLIRDEAKARIIREQVSSLPFVVEAIHRAPLTIAPPEPYQLAELLHDAKVHLGLGPAATMAIVGTLWHGVAVDGRIMGLISSYSSETVGATDRVVLALRRQVVTLHGEAASGDAPVIEAGMILPLHPELGATALAASLNQEETALYELIRTRALASQMRTAVGETITVDLRAGKKNIFQAHFHELLEPGFLAAAPRTMARIHPPCPIPGIREDQEFRPTVVRSQRITSEGQGAERYTIETLLGSLAEFAIPSDPVTIAMVDSLIRAEYATLSDQGAFTMTNTAAKVVSLLDRAFPRMQGVNLAAYIAQTIVEAVSGRKELSFALKQFEQTMMLHGKTLVRAKVTTAKLQPRLRSSTTTIIKQASPSLEAKPAIDRGTAGSDSPSPPEAPPPEEAEGLTDLGPVSRGEEEPEPIAEPMDPEPLPEEIVVAETIEEPGNGDDREPRAVAEADLDEPWSDELTRLFSAALTGSTPAGEAESGMAPLPAPGDIQASGHAAQPDQERRCPVCGRAMVLKEDPFGAFWGCSGFPGCRYSEAVTVADQGVACPLCGQGLSRKQTPTGKSFYVCAQSDCQFMSWSRPHYLPCGLCDSPYLVEKTVRGLGRLRCPRAGCPYEQPLPGGSQAPDPPTGGPGPKKVLVRRGAGAGATKTVRVVRRRQ